VDFERVLRTLLADFNHQQIRYAAIGGFALGVLGVPRATMDLDFLTQRDDLDKLHIVLTPLGYQRYVQTENVSQYRHAEALWGSVDIVPAFRKAALGMLSRAKSFPIFGGAQEVRVINPEDVIGLKVQVMVNDHSLPRSTAPCIGIEHITLCAKTAPVHLCGSRRLATRWLRGPWRAVMRGKRPHRV